MSKKRPSKSQSEEANISTKRRYLAEVQEVISSQIQNSQTPDISIRSGKIARIQLKNFMCHSNLVCDFHNRVNLIIGQNGSGKSAILTALIVGLGSRATATSRATSIKQLVKNGSTSADIEITIVNNGSDSYDPHIFGNYITICRHIAATGSSTYKIKNESGDVVSKKPNDLHKILLYHNIQTDNPVFVLNQDAARAFLKEMNPSKNYELFLKATQIETTLTKLNQCGLMYNDYKYRLHCYKKEADGTETELNELKEKYKRLKSVDKIKEDIENYKLERLWLKVTEQEKVVTTLEEQIEKLQHKRDTYTNHCTKKDAAEAEYKKQIQELSVELAAKNNSLHVENQKLNNLKLAYEEENESFQNEESNYKKIENRLQDYRQQIQELEKSITERSGDEIEKVKARQARNELSIVQLQSEQQEIEALIEQSNRDINVLKETKRKYEEDFENLKSQRQKVVNKIDTCQSEIFRIDNSSKDQISVYGPSMGHFLKEIEKAHSQGKFSALPRGPLGRYISVPNQKWRSVVENLASSLISAFIVNTQQDQIVLNQIKSKFPDVRITIIKSKFHNTLHDVRRGACVPPEGTTLFMNEIKCDDPVVMNCLIDQLSIETQLLTDDQTLASNLTKQKEKVPRNLRRLILLKPFLEYFPAPLHRTYSMKPRPARFIQTNLQELKKNIEREILELKKLKNEYETNLRSLKDKLGNIYQQIRNTDQQLSQHMISKSNNVEKIKDLRSIEYPDENQVEFLKKEKIEIELKVVDLQQSLNDKEAEIEDMKLTKKQKETQYMRQKKKNDGVGTEIQELRFNVDELKNKLNQLLIEATTWSNRIGELNAKILNKKNDLETEADKLIELTSTAQETGDRVETNKTDEELEKSIKKSQFLLKQMYSTEESAEDIKMLIIDKELKFTKNIAFIDAMTQTLELLKRSRLRRFKLIKSLKSHMSLRVKYTFDSVLKIRNFAGKIDIDHTNQTLTMEVIPRDNHVNGAVSNTKSLSGGERSYSTIALLISLWSCVDHPFYFLDEYDVFTDQMNREIMTKLLLKEAEKKPLRQYAFLTPQDISFVSASDTVKIHRLAEPER